MMMMMMMMMMIIIIIIIIIINATAACCISAGISCTHKCTYACSVPTWAKSELRQVFKNVTTVKLGVFV